MTHPPDTAQPRSARGRAVPTMTPAAFAAGNEALTGEILTGLSEVETRLNEVVAQTATLPDSASRHLLSAGGKRVRPMLVLLTAHLGDHTQPAVVEAATTVELIHLATLYHDDVMDDAPVRRGTPSAHEVWGNSVAILTGDLLFARASLVTAAMGPQAVELQARTFERLVLGQLNEFTGPQPDDDPIEHYLQVLADKTGSLIAAAGEYGVRSAGAPEQYVPLVREYGERVGVAFQLADDIIDLTATSRTSGKTPGTDLREGVPTLPVLYVRQDAQRGDAAAADVVRLLDSDLSSDAALEAARAALVAHPATQRARATAEAWAQQAKDCLASLPAGLVREGLAAFADSVVNRSA